MIKIGWIECYQDKVDQLRSVLNFFGVASPEQWHEFWSNVYVDFRKSNAFQSDPGAVTAWLRRGEIEAAEIKCAVYNVSKFKEILPQIRALTLEPPQVFQPEVVRLCAEAGVAVVFVPQLPKTRTCGATRWLNPNKALIQLSLRHKTDDHLWFAFFHEAGHIVLHGKRDIFLEEKGSHNPDSQNKEEEANEFAAEILISPTDWKRFLASGRNFSKERIQKFAMEIGIAPGIVVGRLQHDGVLANTHCNDLKRRFEWADNIDNTNDFR